MFGGQLEDGRSEGKSTTGTERDGRSLAERQITAAHDNRVSDDDVETPKQKEDAHSCRLSRLVLMTGSCSVNFCYETQEKESV
jgi:hypothetical protein